MSQIVSALKLPLKVDEESAAILDGQSKICNWLYNHLLDNANYLKKTFIETKEAAVSLILYSKRGLRNLVPDIKQKDSPLLTLKKCCFKIDRCNSRPSKLQKRQKTRENNWLAQVSFLEEELVFV